MKINKTWAVLGGALVVGVVATFGAHRYISNQLAEIDARERSGRTIRVVVAKQDLQRGTKLTADNIAVRTIPAEYAQSGAVLPEQFDRIEQQAIAYNLKAGEAVMWSQLEAKRVPSFSSLVASGRRAMTVPVDEISSISGMLEPGDIIDLLATVERKGKRVTLPIIQSVSVLATGQRVSPAGGDGSRSYTTITLDTTPDEARRLVVAREAGKLTALLRNPEDKNMASNSTNDFGWLFGEGESGIDPGIPVIYGGRGQLPHDIPQLAASAKSRPLTTSEGVEAAARTLQVISNTTLKAP